MRTKLPTLFCVVAISLTLVPSAFAEGEQAPEPAPSAIAVIADTVIARPACLCATVIGSAFFVLALPWATMSHSVKTTADALVVRPVQATFARPLGDLPSLAE